MVSNKQFEPEYIVVPGEILLMHLEAEGMSQAELALRTGLTPKTINKIVAGTAPISVETAIRFERVLGYPASYWNDLEKYYREHLAKQEAAAALEKEYAWVKLFPLKEMEQYFGVEIDRKDCIKTTENVLRFLGVASSACGEEELRVSACFRQTNAKTYSPYALYAWLRKGELEAKLEMSDVPFDCVGFKNSLEEIKRLTCNPNLRESYQKLKRICAKFGVFVLFVHDLPKMGTNGATRWIDGHPVIQLSLRLRSNDQIWFTFFHEAMHVLNGHGKKNICINRSAREDEDERVADELASNFLIPKKKLQDFLRFGRNPMFVLRRIPEFAKELGVAPAIVLGRLQHDKILNYSLGQDYKIHYSWGD